VTSLSVNIVKTPPLAMFGAAELVILWFEVFHAPAWLWPALVATMLPSTRPVGEVLVNAGLGQGRAIGFRRRR
jgi:hypothetical protein